MMNQAAPSLQQQRQLSQRASATSIFTQIYDWFAMPSAQPQLHHRRSHHRIPEKTPGQFDPEQIKKLVDEEIDIYLPSHPNQDQPPVKALRDKNRFRLHSQHPKQQIEFLDYYDQDKYTEYRYCCPICLRYFNHILVSNCCSNYICRECIKQMCRRSVTHQAEYRIRCPHCAEQSFCLKDVDPSADLRQYTDTPAHKAKKQESFSQALTEENNFAIVVEPPKTELQPKIDLTPFDSTQRSPTRQSVRVNSFEPFPDPQKDLRLHTVTDHLATGDNSRLTFGSQQQIISAQVDLSSARLSAQHRQSDVLESTNAFFKRHNTQAFSFRMRSNRASSSNRMSKQNSSATLMPQALPEIPAKPRLCKPQTSSKNHRAKSLHKSSKLLSTHKNIIAQAYKPTLPPAELVQYYRQMPRKKVTAPKNSGLSHTGVQAPKKFRKFVERL